MAEKEYDFELRGSDAHRLSPEMKVEMKRPTFPSMPFPHNEEERLYQFGAPNTAYKTGGDGKQDDPDSVILSNRNKSAERFEPRQAEGNSEPMQKESDRKVRR